jgi:hypothetical protein
MVTEEVVVDIHREWYMNRYVPVSRKEIRAWNLSDEIGVGFFAGVFFIAVS